MSWDNLLVGLVGGVIGGLLGLAGALIVMRAEHQRWQYENRAGTLLVHDELTFDLLCLRNPDTMVDMPQALSTSTWKAEQVRVASFLTKTSELERVATAYQKVQTVLTIVGLGWDRTQIRTHFSLESGKRQIADVTAAVEDAIALLNGALKL